MEISIWLALALMLVASALGVGVGLWLGSARERERHHAGVLVRERELAATQARCAALEQETNSLIERAGRDSDIMQRLAPISKQLETMDLRVNQLGQKQAAQQSQLTEQLRSAAESHHRLHEVTSSLATAMRSSSARGTWGEVELVRIVEAAGMLPHVHMELQQATGSQSRPDMTILLPGGGKVAVDAKVPLAAYLNAVEIEPVDEESRSRQARLLADHAKAVRAHVNALSKRDYPSEFPGSPQLAVLFMPTESLLAEAVRQDPAILDDAMSKGIALTSPATLLALLRTVGASWSSHQVTHEAEQIVSLGKEMLDRLATLAGHLSTLGNSLRSSVKHYNSAIGSLESNLLVTARRFQALDYKGKELTGVTGDDAQIRDITQPELAERAG